LDYTELIASPSQWADRHRLRRIAEAVGLPPHQERALVENPDTFLQSPFRDPEGAAWIEHPVMSMELDRAWERYIDDTVGSSVRTAAIVSVFADSPGGRQTAPVDLIDPDNKKRTSCDLHITMGGELRPD
jgi:hypothetical protein